MAKETTKVETPEIVEETPEQVIARIQSSMVQVYLAPGQKGENNSVFVGLNGKGYTVPRGRPVMVPWPVFEILRRTADAKVYTEALEKQAASMLNDPAMR